MDNNNEIIISRHEKLIIPRTPAGVNFANNYEYTLITQGLNVCREEDRQAIIIKSTCNYIMTDEIIRRYYD